MSNTATPPIRGFHDYHPQKSSALILEQVASILSTNAEFLPLSIRQIFYMGVSQFGWPKTDKFYQGLCAKLTRARRASLISFGDIRDDGTTQVGPLMYESEASFMDVIRHSAESFRLDVMQTQPRDVLVWCEGQGLVPMVKTFCDPYGVSVISSGGFDGVTLKHSFAQRCCLRDTVVLHIGDYDPSGEVMFRALAEDVVAFGGRADFKRIAVTREQIELMGLPTKPAKTTKNSHAASFNDDRTVELEAISPSDLRDLITAEIENEMDLEALAQATADSAAIRSKLMERFL